MFTQEDPLWRKVLHGIFVRTLEISHRSNRQEYKARKARKATKLSRRRNRASYGRPKAKRGK